MKSFARVLAGLAFAALLATLAAQPAAAQGKDAGGNQNAKDAPKDQAAANADQAQLTQKLNAYVGCINRLSARSYESRSRYFSWAAQSGPTGRERIIYGTYTIYDTSDCVKNVEKANAMEPRDAELEAAATAYAKAVAKLEPLLKEAEDYYQQQDYKDDKMAKGRALHPMLVAAWDAFASADKALRAGVETINDKRALQKLAAIEKDEGRSTRFLVESLMINAKRVWRSADKSPPDLAGMMAGITDCENAIKETEAASGRKIGSLFMSNAKSFLTSGKQLMRRIRDKVPYSQGDKMLLGSGGGGWMVEGSPQRLLRDYNQLVDAYNRGTNI